MEQSWLAVVGKNTDLSLAELKMQLTHLSPSFQSISSVADQVLEIKGELPSLAALGRLGGTIKAARLLGTTTSPGGLGSLLLKIALPCEEHRLDIGLSFYGTALSYRDIAVLALRLKKNLKSSCAKPIRVIFPQSSATLASAVVAKQLLGKGGREFIIVEDGSRFLVAETIWIHPFEEWAEREYGKPDVDKKRGLLPQKLARIMVNLCGLDLDDRTTVFDPFCGSGVILMEARELDCHILGSDADSKAVRATKRNLGLSESDERIWQAEAQQVQLPRSFSTSKLAIVTEPYLGPTWNNIPGSVEKIKVVEELIRLYGTSLAHWRTFLSAGAPVVMVFPVIFGSATFPHIVDRLPHFKYSLVDKPIRYEREGTKVARDIVRLRVS